jgi:translation elongation factor EF-Tu-like GTPase
MKNMITGAQMDGAILVCSRLTGQCHRPASTSAGASGWCSIHHRVLNKATWSTTRQLLELVEMEVRASSLTASSQATTPIITVRHRMALEGKEGERRILRCVWPMPWISLSQLPERAVDGPLMP